MGAAKLQEANGLTIYVLGGSNSLFGNGWVSHYAALKSQEVVNLSVGATTTLAGIYRLLQDGRAGRGDTVVWEYALNEVNHARGGYSVDLLLKNVEHLICICRRRRCRLVMAIFTPRPQELAPDRDPYYDQLLALLDHYGIGSFDMSRAWRAAHGLPAIPAELFADNLHYSHDPALLDFIARGVSSVPGRVPAQVAALRTDGRRLRLLTGFAKQRFTNSIMDVPAAPLPVRIAPGQAGRIIAFFMICRPNEDTGVLAQLHGPEGKLRKLRISTTIDKSFDRKILKAVSIEHATGEAWPVARGCEVSMRPVKAPGPAHAEYQLKRRLRQPVPSKEPIVSGVLVELDPPDRPLQQPPPPPARPVPRLPLWRRAASRMARLVRRA